LGNKQIIDRRKKQRPVPVKPKVINVNRKSAADDDGDSGEEDEEDGGDDDGDDEDDDDGGTPRVSKRVVTEENNKEAGGASVTASFVETSKGPNDAMKECAAWKSKYNSAVAVVSSGRQDLAAEKNSSALLLANCRMLSSRVEALEKRLQEEASKIREMSEVTGDRQVVAAANDYEDGKKIVLGKLIRDTIFSRHKVTTKRSYEDGEIQLICHTELGVSWLDDTVMAAYQVSLVRMVQTELAQRRNQVNLRLLEAWARKFCGLIIVAMNGLAMQFTHTCILTCVVVRWMWWCGVGYENDDLRRHQGVL
jgi:hypothetical protein